MQKEQRIKSNWYTHREPGHNLQKPAEAIPRQRRIGDNIRDGHEREPTRAIKKQNTIRARNQEERVGLILTVRSVSSVVFQLKFLYCQKPRRRQEHNGSSNMKGE